MPPEGERRKRRERTKERAIWEGETDAKHPSRRHRDHLRGGRRKLLVGGRMSRRHG